MQENQYQQNIQPANFEQGLTQAINQGVTSGRAVEYGPRRMTFFTLILKTFAGLIGGTIGSMVFLLILLVASSVLQPLLSPAEATANEISPLFIIILMAMVFITSVISSIITPLFLSYTERERYTRVATSLYQIFMINIVIFVFISPVYFTTSLDRLEFSAYAAGIQIILSALSASLILEIMNDFRYALLGVYTTILGVLVSTAVNLMIYKLFGSATVLLFAALPITWACIGFFQGALSMTYYWYFSNWGSDFLATETSYGADYGVPEPEEEPLPEDRDGSDFFKS